MLNRYAICYKLPENMYRLGEHSDESMETLSIFLGDGLSPRTYIEFLEDASKQKFSGNISVLQKYGNRVTMILFDDFFSDMIPLTTTQDNLIKIVREWNRLEDFLVGKIEVVLNDNDVTIIGGLVH